MSTPLAEFEALVAVLLEQEQCLGELLDLAEEEQRALIHCDYEAVQSVAGRMTAVAAAMDDLEARRDAIVTRLDAGETLREVARAADDLSMPALGGLRTRLIESVGRLRVAQEQNARLILDALRVQDRWYALLSGQVAPTYGAGGRAHLRTSRGLVSKSA
jgi:flagellar biosynthesis/type III secretory pathway chaperone